ncbi:zeta toxin family protein [Cruoricaptor ignavus]|uniref:Zeta toxin family protein n=1 Tax=Cruoricaptor ignavus TaxID=1118202 RepID=A0A7M1T5M4_9FLAO|nr:zeta toxin family protein [Cruoricaptor ignavus]QOR74597.1 zeta toxin family protein [Cruoricaptor ignavus]
MRESEIRNIYEKKKNLFLSGLKSSENPVAVLLGGQPASGKGSLVKKCKEYYPTQDFLIVNGDNFRIFHPRHDELRKIPHRFSSETQIFSNMFTENLINDALNNNYSIIIEGTMRNPDIPTQTCKQFKEVGYIVDALAISAPQILTELGIYVRYQEEVNSSGYGRLADVSSHNQAVAGVSESLDKLYHEKIVNNIQIFSLYAKDDLAYFTLKDNSWNNQDWIPSDIIKKTREDQFNNINLLLSARDRGYATFREIDTTLKNDVAKLLHVVERQIEDLDNKKKRGFKR